MPVICTHCFAFFLMDLRHVVRARNRPDQGSNAGAACQRRQPHGCAARSPCSVVPPKVSSVVTVPSYSDANHQTEFIFLDLRRSPRQLFGRLPSCNRAALMVLVLHCAPICCSSSRTLPLSCCSHCSHLWHCHANHLNEF